MFRLINFFIKLADVFPITMICLAGLVAIGFVSVLRWITTAFSGNDTGGKTLPISPPQKTHSAPLTSSVSKDAIRRKLDELYRAKIITKELLDELFASFQIWSSKPEITASIPSAVTASTVAASVVKESPAPPSSAQATPSRQLGSDQKPSGYFSSENIKTMLISGCALFVLSAYLFVRSYWEHIPAFVKFFSLVIATLGIHIGGRLLIGKKETPKTAETLLTLATLLVPFNFYAGNYLLLDGALSAYTSWAAGAAAMFVVGIYTATLLPTQAMGAIMGLGFIGSFIFGSLASSLTPQSQYLVMSIGSLLLLVISLVIEMKDDVQDGLQFVANGACALVLIGLVSRGLFLDTSNHLATIATLLIIGVIFAIEARTVGNVFAYGAGLCFCGSVAVLLHHFQVPSYKYGLFFIPASIIATLRAWTFERSGRKELAAPYFHLGQLAIAGSLFAILPYFSFYVESGFVTLLWILVIATATYAVNGVLYRNPAFTYLGGAVILFLAWTCSWHYKLAFTEATLLMAAVGSLFVISGLIAELKFDDLLGQPMSIIGLGSVTVCLALLAGKWGIPFLEQGTIHTGLAKDQLPSALWVGMMGTAAYGLVAATRRQAALIFPALASATLTYFFFLEKISFPINLINTSWIVVVSMILFYVSRSIGWKDVSRSFAVWGEIVFAVVCFSGLASRPETALPAVLICLGSFVPGLLLGSVDLATCFLSAAYAAHYIWFRNTIGGTWDNQAFAYGSQLLFLNCGVVFVRSLISAWRPQFNITPYRAFSLAFSAVSLLMVINDKANAWQMYLAYGVLALVVSRVHYQGRFNYVGTTLLLISYELLLWSQDVELTEAYSVPAGLYILVCGYLNRDNKDLKNFLYGIAQVVLYLPSFSKAVNETWEMHGVFLGVESLALMLFGIHQRNKCLTFGSLFVLLTNGVIQSIQFLTAIPRWIYLALGGTTLVGLGGLFEFQREKLIAAKNQMAEAFEGWG